MSVTMCPETRFNTFITNEDIGSDPALFTEKYGAIAACETEDLGKIHARTVRALHIPTILETTPEKMHHAVLLVSGMNTIKEKVNKPDHLFTFDEDGTVHFVPQKQSFFQRYATYRSESHFANITKLQALFQKQQQIVSEFDPEKLTSEHPLQKLRDYATRIRTIQTEQENVKFALYWNSEVFSDSLSTFERLAFRTMSFFHSMICLNLGSQVPALAPLPRYFADFIQKPLITFGETTFTFNQKIVTAKINALFGSWDGKDLSGSVIFNLTDKETGKQLGWFPIFRQWRSSDSGMYCREDTLPVSGVLKDRHLSIRYIDDYKGWDTTTGDRPVRRILTQLAVEIFKREAENDLQVTSNHCDADVYITGGFYTEQNLTDTIRANIQKARAANAIFPAYDNLSSFDVHLKKSAKAIAGTHFTNNAKGTSPALVDFNLGEKPITWESQSAQQPLLPPGSGPILPKFLTKNLFKYEGS
jgi:hypothetical protein